jgi:cellulose biosynthesis protein BcsQ
LKKKKQDKINVENNGGKMNKTGNVFVFHYSKGGVGKTTCSVQTADALAEAGYNVLLIDTDYQDQCRLFFQGLDKESKPDIDGLDAVLTGRLEAEKSLIAIKPNFHFLPAGSRMQETITELETQRTGMFKLDSIFEPFRANYDYIILDTNPSLNVMTFAALFYSGKVIMPISLTSMSLQAIKDCVDYMTDLDKQMKDVKRKLEMAYIFPNLLDFRKPEMQKLLMDANKFSIKVMPPLKSCIHFERLPARHQTLMTYEPISPSKSVADLIETLRTDFRRLVKVLNQKMSLNEAWNDYQMHLK